VMFESYNRHGNNLFIDNIVFTAAVGINNQAPGIPEVKIYPNPNDGHFTISIGNGAGEWKMTVLNLEGQVIHSEIIAPQQGSIIKDVDLSSFARGIYYLRLVSEYSTHVDKIILK
jgi:hypothetical protein